MMVLIQDMHIEIKVLFYVTGVDAIMINADIL